MNDFVRQIALVETYVEKLAAAPEPARTQARELVSAVLAIHREGLSKMVETLKSSDALLEACVADPLVSSLLVLHGLHPDPLAMRVDSALEDARREMQSSASIDVVACSEARVHVRVQDAGDPGSADHARAVVQEALVRAAPDAAEILVTVKGDKVMLPIVAGAVT